MRLAVAVVTPWLNHPELRADYDKAVAEADEVIITDGTPGFAAASNEGLHQATADVVIFLNNDIRLGADTKPDWLTRLAKAAAPDVLVGAKLRRDRHADVGGKSYPYLDGWCVGGLRDRLLELGGFDDLEEPAYYSDNILSLRARKAGMRLREVHTGLVHIGGATSADMTELQVRIAKRANFNRYCQLVREMTNGHRP